MVFIYMKKFSIFIFLLYAQTIILKETLNVHPSFIELIFNTTHREHSLKKTNKPSIQYNKDYPQKAFKKKTKTE